MAARTFSALLAVSATAVAQQTTWGSVVFTYHGEKTPTLNNGPYNLSPLGASQLYLAGQAIRERYISPPNNGSVITDPAPINGISKDAIDNSQLDILSTDDEFISASGLAFMQGLYPPRGGPILEDQSYYLANGSLAQYPLDNYQYPSMSTVDILDMNSIWVAGNLNCPTYSIAQVEYMSDPAYAIRMAEVQDFYDSLADTIFYHIDHSLVNYRYAYQLYEYGQYVYNHNYTLYNSSTFSSEDLKRLYTLASEQQFDLNSPNNYGTVPAISASTLASRVLQQFNHITDSNGVADKMSIHFGSYEPFLAFFALANMATGSQGEMFKTLPLHGSVMAFELFSYPQYTGDNLNLSNPFPSTDELWVRFLLRNGTDPSSALIAYPLFGRSPQEFDMSWSDFLNGMADFTSDNVGDWCNACQSVSMFCDSILDNMSNSTGTKQTTKSHDLSPAIYGVIGATITIGIGILVLIGLCLFGFRIEYHEGNAAKAPTADLGVLRRSGSATGGGFKGAEKLASDTDLRLKGGAGATVVRHERVGSWELNESPTKQGSLDKDVESGRVVRGADYGRRSEDGMERVDPFGDPVKAVDTV